MTGTWLRVVASSIVAVYLLSVNAAPLMAASRCDRARSALSDALEEERDGSLHRAMLKFMGVFDIDLEPEDEVACGWVHATAHLHIGLGFIKSRERQRAEQALSDALRARYATPEVKKSAEEALNRLRSGR